MDCISSKAASVPRRDRNPCCEGWRVGWYPKPTEISSEVDMQRLFKHDDPEFDDVIRYTEYAGITIGTRQTWFYDVAYANEKVYTFYLSYNH